MRVSNGSKAHPEAQKFYAFLRDEMGVTKVRFPETSSFGVNHSQRKAHSDWCVQPLIYALQHGLLSVTLVHKGNIMKFTEGGFKRWGYEVAETEFKDQTFTMNEYDRLKKELGEESAKAAVAKAINDGKVVVKDCIADAFLQNTLLIPEEYSVIATLNLNGDYVSRTSWLPWWAVSVSHRGANINYKSGHAILWKTSARVLPERMW